MTRKDILDVALKCVNGDRDQQYGSPEDSFLCIAEFWNNYIRCRTGYDVHLESSDTAAMLALLKLARIAGGQVKDDNWIDLAGYAACGGEVQCHSYLNDDNDSMDSIIKERLGFLSEQNK